MPFWCFDRGKLNIYWLDYTGYPVFFQGRIIFVEGADQGRRATLIYSKLKCV